MGKRKEKTARELSAYNFMWMIVMFDLPVGTREERRDASDFRNWLLDSGFEMSQYSVYMRFCVSKEDFSRRLNAVSAATPKRGRVHVLSVTDKQFERMTVFRGATRSRGRKPPGQLDLF